MRERRAQDLISRYEERDKLRQEIDFLEKDRFSNVEQSASKAAQTNIGSAIENSDELIDLRARLVEIDAEIMAQVFYSIEMAYREDKKTKKKLSDYLILDTKNVALNRLAQQDNFETAVTNLNLDEITLAQFGLETFHLVRSFSFVGDPVYIADTP